MTSECCPLVSLRHVLLAGAPPGYVLIEGQITSMAMRTEQQEEVAACLNQAAMARWPAMRSCGTLAGNTAVCAHTRSTQSRNSAFENRPRRILPTFVGQNRPISAEFRHLQPIRCRSDDFGRQKSAEFAKVEFSKAEFRLCVERVYNSYKLN